MNKWILIVGGGIVGVLALGAFCRSTAFGAMDRGDELIDSAAMFKSIELGEKQVGVISQMAGAMTFQNVIIAVLALGGMLILYKAFTIFSHGGGGAGMQFLPAQNHGYTALPGQRINYVAFGPRGQQFIRSLPREKKEELYYEICNVKAELEQQLGISTDRQLVAHAEPRRGKWS